MSMARAFRILRLAAIVLAPESGVRLAPASEL